MRRNKDEGTYRKDCLRFVNELQICNEKKLNIQKKTGELERIKIELQNDIEIHNKDITNFLKPKLQAQQQNLIAAQEKIEQLQQERVLILQAFQSKEEKVSKSDQVYLQELHLKTIENGEMEDELENQRKSLNQQADQLLHIQSQLSKMQYDFKEKNDLLVEKQNEELNLEQ